MVSINFIEIKLSHLLFFRIFQGLMELEGNNSSEMTAVDTTERINKYNISSASDFIDINTSKTSTNHNAKVLNTSNKKNKSISSELPTPLDLTSLRKKRKFNSDEENYDDEEDDEDAENVSIDDDHTLMKNRDDKSEDMNVDEDDDQKKTQKSELYDKKRVKAYPTFNGKGPNSKISKVNDYDDEEKEKLTKDYEFEKHVDVARFTDDLKQNDTKKFVGSKYGISNILSTSPTQEKNNTNAEVFKKNSPQNHHSQCLQSDLLRQQQYLNQMFPYLQQTPNSNNNALNFLSFFQQQNSPIFRNPLVLQQQQQHLIQAHISQQQLIQQQLVQQQILKQQQHLKMQQLKKESILLSNSPKNFEIDDTNLKASLLKTNDFSSSINGENEEHPYKNGSNSDNFSTKPIKKPSITKRPSPTAATSPTTTTTNTQQPQNKDLSYLERRRKNNEAAKRSRDLRRVKEEEMIRRARLLENDNVMLKSEIRSLKVEISRLHQLLSHRIKIP